MWSSPHQYNRQKPSLILWVCLYSLSYVYLYHIFCTRPAGLSVCLFVYQNVQGANGKHITIKKDTWKPMVSTQVQEVAHFVLRLPKFCHQLLFLSKSNLILANSNMGGSALKASTWSYHINLNFAIYLDIVLIDHMAIFTGALFVTFSMSYIQIIRNIHREYFSNIARIMIVPSVPSVPSIPSFPSVLSIPSVLSVLSVLCVPSALFGEILSLLKHDHLRRI